MLVPNGKAFKRGAMVVYVLVSSQNEADRFEATADADDAQPPIGTLPAIVVRVKDAEKGVVDLHVLFPWPSGWQRNVLHDQIDKLPGTWHWE